MAGDWILACNHSNIVLGALAFALGHFSYRKVMLENCANAQLNMGVGLILGGEQFYT